MLACQAMIERSEKIIKHATLSKIRMQRPDVAGDIYNTARINHKKSFGCGRVASQDDETW